MASGEPLSDEDYHKIAAFRAGLRRFLRQSEEAALRSGLTPQQHQLLLSIRGFQGTGAPTITDLANALQIRHHSAVGLVNRLEESDYLRREASAIERRKVHVYLTQRGVDVLHSLTDVHRREYRQLADLLQLLLDRIAHENQSGSSE